MQHKALADLTRKGNNHPLIVPTLAFIVSTETRHNLPH